MKNILYTFLLCMLYSWSTLFAQHSDFTDPTFNNGTTAYFYPSNLTKKLTDMVVLDDGSMILCGSTMSGSNNYDFNAIKVNPDGSLDTTFADQGFLFIDFNSTDLCEAAAVQSNGKILMAGTINDYEAVVVRIDQNGQFDTSFGADGILRFIYESWSYTGKIMDIKVASDDSFYLTGERSRLLLMHFSKDGVLDSQFGVNGFALADNDLANSLGQNILIQKNGKILVTGLFTTNWQNISVRFNPDGSIDTTYGNNGTAISELRVYQSSGDKFKGVLQNDGKLLIAGYKMPVNGSDDMAVVRLNTDGRIDSTFGINGYALADYDGMIDNGHDVLVANDGRIIVGGKVTDSNNFSYFGICAFSENGILDTDFGAEGFGTAFGYRLISMAFYGDKIAAAGFNSQNGGYAATRFQSISTVNSISYSNILIPKEISLGQNYPNPFNPSTTINFSLSNSGNISLVIYDIMGRKVETLVNDFLQAGYYSIKVDWRKRPGAPAGGTYIYQLKTGNNSISRRMQLLK